MNWVREIVLVLTIWLCLSFALLSYIKWSSDAEATEQQQHYETELFNWKEQCNKPSFDLTKDEHEQHAVMCPVVKERLEKYDRESFYHTAFVRQIWKKLMPFVSFVDLASSIPQFNILPVLWSILSSCLLIGWVVQAPRERQPLVYHIQYHRRPPDQPPTFAGLATLRAPSQATATSRRDLNWEYGTRMHPLQ
jgi:hypothetical protein